MGWAASAAGVAVRRWAAGPGGTKALASCGIAGPVLFTAAWVASSLWQVGYRATEVQLSGLAAVDASNPEIMIGGFVGLGVCSAAFGAALGRVGAAGSAGPWLVRSAGVATIAAGVFRRDQVLLTGPGFAGESWHNQVHDLVSGVAYGAMIVAPLVLASRLRSDPDWAAVSRLVQVLVAAGGAALVVFASGVVQPWNGTVQRVAVSLPLAAEVLMAARILSLARRQAVPCQAVSWWAWGWRAQAPTRRGDGG
jgi:Protein of unknown function (DUF998)